MRPTTGRTASTSPILLSLALMAVAADQAYAEAWQIEPSVSLQASFDDNARMTVEGDEDEVLATSLIGAVELGRITEIGSTRGVLRWDAIRYSGDDEQLDDRDNQLARLQHRSQGELSEWGVEASLRRDTLLRTVDVNFDPQDIEIEPDDDVDDVLVRQSIRRERLVVRPHYTRNLSERLRLRTEYRYNTVDFDHVEGAAVTAYTDHSVTVGAHYDVSEIDTVTFSVGGGRYTADDFDRTYESVELRGGYSHAFSELTTGVVELGVNRLSFDTDGESGDDTGFIFSVGGTKRTGLTRFSGTAGRRLYPSGSGDVIRSDEIKFRMNRRLTERSGIRLRARLFENEALSRDRPESNRRFLNAEAAWIRSLTQWWSFETSYRYRRQKRDVDPDSASSNAVFVSVKYTKPSALGDLF